MGIRRGFKSLGYYPELIGAAVAGCHAQLIGSGGGFGETDDSVSVAGRTIFDFSEAI